MVPSLNTGSLYLARNIPFSNGSGILLFVDNSFIPLIFDGNRSNPKFDLAFSKSRFKYTVLVEIFLLFEKVLEVFSSSICIVFPPQTSPNEFVFVHFIEGDNSLQVVHFLEPNVILTLS